MIREADNKDSAVIDVARKMLVAAKTAPKGKGVDNIEMMVLTDNEIKELSDYLLNMVEEKKAPRFFARDAKNILHASALFLIGTKIATMGLSPCGLCGFENCAEKKKYADVPCSFNTGDLGIAIGSAAGIAMDNRVDNRIMYTVGIAAKEMNLLGSEVKIIYGIPLCSESKNPFFDRI